MLVNRMTAWQRNQWARAGYPILASKVEAFTLLRRPDRLARAS